MILGPIFIEKVMLFAVQNSLPCQCVEKGKVLTAKIIVFSMKNRSQNHMRNMSKKYNFLFYVGNVFVGSGEHAECLGTFLTLGPYRLEK